MANKKKSEEGYYDINTELGSNFADYTRLTGERKKMTDGAELSLGNDGNVYAFHNGNKLLVRNNWKGNQPPAPDTPYAVKQYTTPGTDMNAALAEYFNASRKRSGSGAYPGSEWDDRTRQLINRALGLDYTDWTQGDQYKALADRYAQQGQRAMDETVAQIAARTGGLASSYAGVAGQAQYNEYMRQLEDAARQQFAQQRADAIQNAGLSQQMGSEAYQRWQDEQRRRATEDNLQMQMLQQIANNEESERTWQHGLDREALEDEERAENKKYTRSQTEKAEEQEKKDKADAAAEKAQKDAREEVDEMIEAGLEPTPEQIAASGYSPERIAAKKQKKALADAAAVATATARASRSGGSGNDRRTGGGFEDMYESMPQGASLAEITQWLRDNGAKGNTSAYAKRYMEIQRNNTIDVVWAMRDAQEPLNKIIQFINSAPNGTFTDTEKKELGNQVRFLYRKIGKRP